MLVLTLSSLLPLACYPRAQSRHLPPPKKTNPLSYAEQVHSRDVELETLAYSTAEMAVVIDQSLRLAWKASGHPFCQKCINSLWHYCAFDYKLLIWVSVTQSERCPKIPGFTFRLPKALWRGFPSFSFSSLTDGLCFTSKSLLCCAGFVFLSDIFCHPTCLAMLFRHWHHILTDCLLCVCVCFFFIDKPGQEIPAGSGLNKDTHVRTRFAEFTFHKPKLN